MAIYNFQLPELSDPSQVSTDLSSLDYSNPSDFLEEIKSEFIERKSSQKISVGLWSSVGSKSVPLLYKDLIMLWETHSHLKVTLQIFIQSSDVLDNLYRFMPLDFRPKKILEIKNGHSLTITVGDIVLDPKDPGDEAIVNASNENLILGGGVSHSIRQHARPTLQNELHALAKNKITIGHAAVTGAHGIAGIGFIIHVPTASGTEEAIYKGTFAALQAAERRGVEKLVFPALGTGTGGLSIQKCSQLMLKAIQDFSSTYQNLPKAITIKLWTKSDFDIFISEL